MITRDQIPAVLDHPVYDGTGAKIGEAKHVFLDDATGRPEWVSVKTGLFGSSETFVPIRDASVVEDHLEVPYTKDKVKDAPDVVVDSGGHLSREEEHRLYEYYGVKWDEPWEQSTGQDKSSTSGRSGMDAGTAGAAGAAGAAGGVAGGIAGKASARGRKGEDADDSGRAFARGTAAEGRTTGAEGRATGAGGQGIGAEGRTPGSESRSRSAAAGSDLGRETAENAMTRSEERMHVRVEREQSGRARLHKYVDTEEVQQSVPLRYEEVRVVREPITDANRSSALSGEPLKEAEYEVTLHSERPVIETEVVPVERVRLTTEERVQNKTVTGRVRKERIETEGFESSGTDTSSGVDTSGMSGESGGRGKHRKGGR
jgi:stress response protein YsnF